MKNFIEPMKLEAFKQEWFQIRDSFAQRKGYILRLSKPLILLDTKTGKMTIKYDKTTEDLIKEYNEEELKALKELCDRYGIDIKDYCLEKEWSAENE